MSHAEPDLHSLLESTVSAAKASISVILVLVYGYFLRKWDYLSKTGESNVSKIGTTFLLPALLFTEIGPLATVDNLRTYWPIIPASMLFQAISLGFGEGSRAFGMPQHYVPIFVFNNVTSLPLLLIDALAATGSLDDLVPVGDTLASVVKRGRVYILINALVGNLTRFASGPYLMKTHKEIVWAHPHHDDPDLDVAPIFGGGQIRLPETDDEESLLPPTKEDKLQSVLQTAQTWVSAILNPPLLGGFSAVFFGLVPWFHRQLFDSSGWLTPLAESISSVGNLYTALQMLVLGAHLYSKRGGKAQPWLLVWLFSYRFFIAPTISIFAVWAVSSKWPHLINTDPVMHFVIMISNVGPPALTLSAIAEIADLTPEIEGQVSRIITLSYAVTPLIAVPITAALEVIRHTGIGKA